MLLLAPAPAPKPKSPPAAKVGELHAPQLLLWRAFFCLFPKKLPKIPYKIEKLAEICGDFPLLHL